jgi:hypothetical protein
MNKVCRRREAQQSLRIFTIWCQRFIRLSAIGPERVSISRHYFSVNLLALMLLFPTLNRLLADYRQQLKEGIENPILDLHKYSDLDLDHSAWDEKVSEYASENIQAHPRN